MRDLDADQRAGRVTLAAVLGIARARWVYAGLCLVPFVILTLTPSLAIVKILGLAAELAIPSVIYALLMNVTAFVFIALRTRFGNTT